MIVGIDLGTTNSLIAVCQNGKPELIPNRLGKYLTPSVVAVDDDDNILVGQTAKEYGYLYPERVAKVFKRTMGTNTIYKLKNKEFNSIELSSFVLRSLIEDANQYLNQTITEAIISVPAYFDDNQRKATKQAGELIGLNVSRIISEPTASAIAYGIGQQENSERCMVFDLGGGTFDVSILEYYMNIIEVGAISGDNKLGGEDFTKALMDLFKKKANIRIMDIFSLSNLYRGCEQAKISIDNKDNFDITVKIGAEYLTENITLEEYEEACADLLDRIRKPIEKSLHDADVSLDDVDRVILVGGASKLAIVKNFVYKITGIIPEHYVDPDTSVALGASLAGAMKERQDEIKEIILTDVCPFTLGTEVVKFNGVIEQAGYFLPIIERNTVIPVSKKEIVSTAHDNQEHVTINILQGESRLAKNNILLGSIDIDVPKGPKGKEEIEITYTYDVDSLLEVEVRVLSTGEKKSVVIQNNDNRLSDEEVKKRLEELKLLKQNPREQEENYLVLIKANKVYEDLYGKERDILEEAIFAFEKAMDKGSYIDIEKSRKNLLELIEDYQDDDQLLLS